MPLNIETFSNLHGGNAFFKAISHPLAAPKAAALLADLKNGAVAIYDPLQLMEAFSQFYPAKPDLAGYFIQNIDHLYRSFAGQSAQPVTELKNCKAQHVLVAAFDAERFTGPVRHLMPQGAKLHSFDSLRLPENMLTDAKNYLSPMNFATNFAFFREEKGHHTRLVTANYWGNYGADDVQLWCCLFAQDGKVLGQWQEKLGAAGSAVIIDSQDVRARFNAGEFTGQLFIHAIGVKGHDTVKYALDTTGTDEYVLSCTHDANSWPSDYYAGLPAPDDGEKSILWVQNSQPFSIPAGEINLAVMGTAISKKLDKEIPAFATYALSVAELLPEARWPQQVEIFAGKYIVRPRYEVFKDNRQRIAHVNVQRSDIKPDPRLAEIGALMGKGFILPAPVLPIDRYDSYVLPTPMAREQKFLPLTALIYDASGEQAAEYNFGNLPRDHASLLNVRKILADNNCTLKSGYGHVELIYDFTKGQEADGWLHGLFRYTDEKSGHRAESSFGSHMFNTVLTYQGEPQSYAGRPPGLSTRLFLRLGARPFETFCHLIYPASTSWHAQSDTNLILISSRGEEVAKATLKVPCGGSRRVLAGELFTSAQREAAGEGGYITVRDTTCRLFGYHGLMNGDIAFSLDHMFGF